MAALRDPTSAGANKAEAAASRLPPRWREVFRGDERELRALRRWLADLFPACPAHDDLVTVAVELATNAVKFTRSGRGGWFTVEITWYGQAMRVVVADAGGPTGPHLIDDPLSDHGRGLQIVRTLSARMGVMGDHRGRLVWAEIPWTSRAVADPGEPHPGHEAEIRQDSPLWLSGLPVRRPGLCVPPRSVGTA